ncbi:MAG: ATP-binding protein [Bacilli bacterium]|nr:ATP-binding protein [Bacilli bacterium]
MKIAILSGKGGTGKTFLATNLAYVSQPSTYIDADVEEPNGNLFLRPTIDNRHQVFVKIPEVDQGKCSGCRRCTEFCRYHALAYSGGKLIIFPTLCHSCGACTYLCPEQALKEVNRSIGYYERGTLEKIEFYSGVLKPGQLSGVPIIETLMNVADGKNELTWIDCPPGVACQVISCVEDADYCLLVAEDSLFGLDNLKMAHELAKTLHKPVGVIINKCFDSKSVCDAYCQDERLKVIERIPYDIKLANLGAKGYLAAKDNTIIYQMFFDIYYKIMREVDHETTPRS